MSVDARPKAGQRAWNLLDSRAITRTIQIVAIASLTLALLVGVRQYSLAGCLSRNQTDAANASGQRLQAAEADRKALDEMIAGIAGARGAPPSDAGKRVSDAFDKYLRTRAEADEQRRRNPPPPPPSQACN